MELMVAPSAESIIQHFSENASLARGFGQWLLVSALHIDKIDKRILRLRRRSVRRRPRQAHLY